MLYKGPYNSNKTEPEILKYWLENKFFKPEYHPTKGLQSLAELKTDNRLPFTIINPPPNAYMRPHIGNVSGYAYQDLFLRYNRMLGKKVLGQPGKDHAGIQGEVVVDKIFQQNKGKTKQDMGREKFYKASYSHFEKLMPMVMKDEQRIGLSSDYDRNLFTLDPKVVKTVLGTFLKMFKDKMVYKGVRIVNWDPVAKTTLADIDTEYEERKSELVYIRYPLVKSEARSSKFETNSTFKPQKLKTIVFDLSGVLFLDTKEKYQKLAKALNIPQIEKLIELMPGNKFKLWDKLRTGEITTEQLWEQIAIKLNIKKFDPQEINRIWFDDYSLNKELFNYAKNLKKQGFKLGILSNTLKERVEYLDHKFNFLNIFDYIFLSYEQKLLKPDKKIFKKFEQKFNLKSEEILLVDDRQEVLDIAQKAGWTTFLYNNNTPDLIDFIEKGQWYITVATTRPETMLGDTAIVVNPKDKRYKNLIGEKVLLPLANREIPIISSPRVDTEFGTGAVKLTPAHSYDDYVMMNEWNNNVTLRLSKSDRQKAQLAKSSFENLRITSISYINIIDKNARMTGPIPAKYKDMTTEECRKAVIEDLEKKGLIVKREPYIHSVMIGERSKATIEQIMSSQWFIDVEKLKKPAIDAVKKGEIKIHPEYMQKKYLHWMENLHDWPVSRSLWWGYRIPVWYKGEVKEETDQETGQIIQTINGTPVQDIHDAVKKGLAKIQIENPSCHPEQCQGELCRTPVEGCTEKLILIPGKHAYTNRKIYPALQKKYPDSVYIEVENIDNPFYKDLENAFKKEFNHPSTSLPYRTSRAGSGHKGGTKNAERIIVIAHSLGTRAIIKYILENKLQIDSLILLAPACAKNPRPKNRNYEDIITNTKDYDKLDKYVKNLHIIYSNDDELMSVEEFEDFAKLFKNAKTHAEKGKKHYAGKDYDEESEALLQILSNKLDSGSEPGLPDGKAGMTLPGNSDNWVQDNDVFDTWFSSGQWVYATLETNNLLDSFYPTDVMETSYDILELWVSRMIMLSLYTQGEIPFKHVYLHGLVKAPDGQKMSKSKGNVISPDEIINKYGADALRLMYVVGNKAGAGYPVSYEKLEGYKRFLNKIWNASKFILSNCIVIPEANPIQSGELSGIQNGKHQIQSTREQTRSNLQIPISILEKQDKELLIKLKKLTKDVTKHIENFRPGMAAELLYQSFWHDFCDVELEAYKPRLYTKDKEGNPINTSKKAQSSKLEAQKMLLYALKTYIKLLHPFIPFITETIWRELPASLREHKTIMYAAWPN